MYKFKTNLLEGKSWRGWFFNRVYPKKPNGQPDYDQEPTGTAATRSSPAHRMPRRKKRKLKEAYHTRDAKIKKRFWNVLELSEDEEDYHDLLTKHGWETYGRNRSLFSNPEWGSYQHDRFPNHRINIDFPEWDHEVDDGGFASGSGIHSLAVHLRKLDTLKEETVLSEVTYSTRAQIRRKHDELFHLANEAAKMFLFHSEESDKHPKGSAERKKHEALAKHYSDVDDSHFEEIRHLEKTYPQHFKDIR